MLSTTHKIAIVVVCLVRQSSARRVLTSSEWLPRDAYETGWRQATADGTSTPLQAFVNLLQVSNPAAAFNPSSARLHSPAGSSKFAGPHLAVLNAHHMPVMSDSDAADGLAVEPAATLEVDSLTAEEAAKADAEQESQAAEAADKAEEEPLVAEAAAKTEADGLAAEAVAKVEASSNVEEADATEELLKTIAALRSQLDDKDKVIEEKVSIIESMKESSGKALETTPTGTGSLPDISTMVQDESVGITGRWKEVAGNFVLYPKDIEFLPPRGVIHFLGGAFVGAAPHYIYRYLLDSLCAEGFIVVTTPYRLKFDYLKICDDVLSKFESVFAELKAEFGPLPVIGIGHSCGALLHTYIGSLFPDHPRAGNVLISWNNKPVTEAIPAFDELVVPISRQVMGTDASESSDAAAGARQALSSLRDAFDDVLKGVSTSAATPSIVKDDLVPVVKQGLEVVDQIPDLFASIAEGAREFTPTPDDTRTIARQKYRVNRTLLIQFDTDEIDETPEIDMVLREASGQLEADMEVEMRSFGGTHITPLTQNVILEPPPLQLDGLAVPDPLEPIRQEVRENFLRTINEVKTEITQWLSRA